MQSYIRTITYTELLAIGGNIVIVISNNAGAQLDQLPLSGLQREILEDKQRSPVTYSYDSVAALTFELKMRENIVEASKALQHSRANFATFVNSKCNEQYWTRTDNGGFQMKSDVRPSDAINDIFTNGELYGFECATAIVIILYKAILDTIGENAFNTHFNPLYLRDWNHDGDLWFITTNNKDESYPGDVMYFKNPDHNPDTPEWQGENVVKLADNLFFGHGIGIETSEDLIDALNRMRVPGSTQSAYLMDMVVHPNFEHLRNLSSRAAARIVRRTAQGVNIIARIGTAVNTR